MSAYYNNCLGCTHNFLQRLIHIKDHLKRFPSDAAWMNWKLAKMRGQIY